jgi:hypothetical protein
MTAKVFCWKVKVTYRCGCHVTGNTIHICDSTKSNCRAWIDYKHYNRDCENCMLEEQGGRNLSGNAESSSHNTELVVEGPTVVEGASTVTNVDQLWERIEPIYYTESARKTTTA